jgi:hypothetical protein
MLRVKRGVVSLAVLAVVLVFGYSAIGPKIDTKQQDSSAIHLSVKFEPATLKKPVHITVFVDGVLLISTQPTQSPWNRDIAAERTALVMLRAVSFEGTELDCLITRPGSKGAFDSRLGPGLVVCQS